MTSRRLLRRVWWLAGLLTAAGCSAPESAFTVAGHRYPETGLTQWALPAELREVSGLALDPEGRLFAHADEAAVIFELDHDAGRVLKRFSLGEPPRPGDYEGIAWARGRLYLVTSDGEVLISDEAADGAQADYRLHRTGLGRRCEIEGLDYDAARDLLLMPCKTPREAALRGRIAVLAVSRADLAPAPEHDLIAPAPGAPPLDDAPHPSGVARAADGTLVLVAAREHAIIELTPEGEILQAFAIPRDRGHPQMEGLAITAAGDLVIADEGKGKRGRLSVYAARQ